MSESGQRQGLYFLVKSLFAIRLFDQVFGLRFIIVYELIVSL